MYYIKGNIYMSRMICCSVVPEIEPGYYGLNENEKFTFSGILSAPAAEGTLADAINFLQKTYSNTMSAEFSYLEVFVLHYESTALTFTELEHFD
jgi:2-oxoglutarate dehydrogenase complex dehydrogenase (E1) component-like enzyme